MSVEATEKKQAYRSGKWLRERYWEEGMSIPELAAEAGVSDRTIHRWMGRLGVETRSRAEAAGRPEIPEGELRRDVERVAEALERRPSSREYDRLGRFSYHTVRIRCGDGSWAGAMDELGI